MAPLSLISGNAHRRTETTYAQREGAIGMRMCGASWDRIGRMYNRPESTLRKIVKQNDYDDAKNKPRSGRPKVLSERTKRDLLRNIKSEPKIEYSELLSAVGLDMSQRRSVQRYLASQGIHKWLAKRRPALTPAVAELRYDFALKWRAILNDLDVEKIIFSDEIYVYFHGNNARHWTFRKAGEQ